MGLYSYTQPSSSSLQVWSEGPPEVNFTGLTVGIPDRCLCGRETVMKCSTTADNPGRIFFGCNNHEDGEDHIMKWWDEAIMQELQAMRGGLDDQRDSITAIKENDEMLWVQQELEKVKDQMKELRLLIRRVRGVVENVFIAGIILIVVLISFAS
ncbi:PREDICTED: uncharacterized protein At4g04775-like [Camelina sativa]|uniref:Uncharacterized protein At4g04775-like n=1 Tax=Camelina sativa TaxID=90675 RepID=A0ABM0X4Y3_CAMSA|nr:PREDICTED: uncharacterized protein At4g04775-like [Camelina sativa]